MFDFHELPFRQRLLLAVTIGGGMSAIVAYLIAGLSIEWMQTTGFSGFELMSVPDKFQSLSPEAQDTILFTACGFVLTIILLLCLLSIRTVSSRYGDAHFAGVRQLKKEGYAARMKVGDDPDSEIVFAKFGKAATENAVYFKPGPEVAKPHAIFIAPSESGKTSGFVVPNLLRFNGSTVALDIKGELFSKTSARREEIGDDVFLFNPSDPGKSHKYNPLWKAAATNDLDQRWVEVLQVANTLLIAKSDGAAGFLENAIGMFASLAMIAIKRQQPYVGEVLRLAKVTTQEQYISMAKEISYSKAAEEFLSFAQEEPKILRSYLSVMTSSGLGIWRNPNVDAATRGSDVKFDDLRRKPASIYFSIPGPKVVEFTPLIRLFFYDLINTIETDEPGKDEPFKVLILLDEFQRLGNMEKVTDAYSTIRSFGGRMIIISQSLSKLQGIYGHEEVRAILANAGTQMFAASDDAEVRKHVSETIGNKTITGKSRSHRMTDLDAGSTSRKEEGVKLVPPEHVGRLLKEKLILLREGQMPAIANKIRYFEDPYFTNISGHGEAKINVTSEEVKLLPAPRKLISGPEAKQITPPQRMQESDKPEEDTSDSDDKAAEAIKKKLDMLTGKIDDLKPKRK